jgi:hypothetical protein
MKKDPYAALRYKEFNIFTNSFHYGFAWSMQFIVIEWQVYSITKDPSFIRNYWFNGSNPCCFLGSIAGHIVDQRKKRDCLSNAYWLFQ